MQNTHGMPKAHLLQKSLVAGSYYDANSLSALSKIIWIGLTRINNFGRGKGRGKKERREKKNDLLFANKPTRKVSLNFSFLCSSDGSLFQIERGTVKRKAFLILFPNWHDEHPGFEVVVMSLVLGVFFEG